MSESKIQRGRNDRKQMREQATERRRIRVCRRELKTAFLMFFNRTSVKTSGTTILHLHTDRHTHTHTHTHTHPSSGTPHSKCHHKRKSINLPCSPTATSPARVYGKQKGKEQKLRQRKRNPQEEGEQGGERERGWVMCPRCALYPQQ